MKMQALAFVLLFLVGCVSVPVMTLNPGAELVKVAKSDPGDNYQEVGHATGVDGKGCGGFGYLGSYERAIVDLKNRAYQMGADYVQIFTITEPYPAYNCFVNEYTISGTAYKMVRKLPSPTPIIIKPTENDALTEKLRLLKEMFDDGLITEKQYQEKRHQLLK